jgi:hypothetical protein
MKVRLALALLGFGVAAPGCSLVASATRNVLHETMLCTTHLVECERNCVLAAAAWKDVQNASLETYSDDYARGFKAGFKDSLEAGGHGDPPPLPPPCYWSARYETVAGHEAIDDWFRGFRHGADVAKESGRRELSLVPLSPPAPLCPGPFPPAPLAQPPAPVPATPGLTTPRDAGPIAPEGVPEWPLPRKVPDKR